MLTRRSSVRLALRCSAAFAILTAATGAAAQDVPIVQPGAPGQPSRTISADEAVRIADTRFSPDDVKFMQDMILHHQQAVEMAALVQSRSTLPAIGQAAGRITASQADEIRFMQTWLRERGQQVPDPAAAHHGDHSAHAEMPGMSTPAQMAALAAARGAAFDRLFLERMIHHHEGAITMARALLRRSGSAYDPVLYEFANDVINEQQAEIERMAALLAPLSNDRRAVLAPGFRDAGQAISNMTLVASLPKPTGFFDPNNPANLPPPIPAEPGATPAPAPAAGAAATPAAPRVGDRSPMLSFANTDMAFSGDLLAVGNYHGFNLYRLVESGAPQLISSVICPGGQGDLSIVGDILIMSVEERRGRTDCGRQGVADDVSAERFRGLRIFDISDATSPRQVGQVQTCRGSHTHSVVSGPANGAIIVYASGTSSVRRSEELEGCVGDVPGDSRTSLFRIDVIEIPVADPSRARIIDSPAVFADPATGNLAGLWRGGSHGEGTQDTSRTDQCHDITVFPSRNLAAGACSGNGIIFDISDPRRPRRLDAVVDPNFAYWHSATFNNDGTKVLFTDEWGGGSRPRCRVQDQRTWGANAIYDIVDGRLRFRSHYKLPAAQTEEENCVAHNGSIVPVPGRDIFVQAWYQGGISVIDFTDSANPVEIAYFDRGPISADHQVLGGFWSAYWYKGRIYGTEIARGLDVLALQPSAHLTANEIAAAALADQDERFNPQQQFPVSWPADPVVAKAYVDQLQRSRSLPAGTIADLSRNLNQATTRLAAGGRDAALAGRLERLASGLRVTGQDPAATRRATALGETLRGIASRLR
ncbi:MAG: DUF305 domain-containing protein [Allosphingosinicella sp.]|uniref:DUF305 domain-containing protein n=1 Tax=Allosphingosinicella sp. TaxID=2823234 RepID=UPI0039262A8D